MAWSEERIRLLKKLWLQGKSTVEIGRALGISKNAVVGKVHRLELNARPSPIRPDIKEEQPIVRKGNKKIRLMDLKMNSCRWPLGDPKEEDFCFCGKTCTTGKPYCPEHCKIAYTSLKELAQQNKQNQAAAVKAEEKKTEQQPETVKPTEKSQQAATIKAPEKVLQNTFNKQDAQKPATKQKKQSTSESSQKNDSEKTKTKVRQALSKIKKKSLPETKKNITKKGKISRTASKTLSEKKKKTSSKETKKKG